MCSATPSSSPMNRRWRRSEEVAEVRTDGDSRIAVLPLSQLQGTTAGSPAQPLVLTGTAAAIWVALCDASSGDAVTDAEPTTAESVSPGALGATAAELAAHLAPEFGVEAAAIQPDVAAFLEELAAARLAE